MPWFGKKKKAEKQKEKLRQQQAINQPASGVVSQQKDSFDVDPAFFESDKVKINEFLTDDKEFIRTRMINDCPNGDYRNLEFNENLAEIKERLSKDEAAFEQIKSTIKINEASAMNDFEIAKNRAINTLASEEPYYVNSTNYSEKQINKIAKGITKEYQHITDKTAKLLKAEHTKILDLNEINETMVSKNSYTEQGGTQTVDPYNSVNGGVNRFDTLMRIHENNHKAGENFKVSDEELEDLKEIKVTSRIGTSDSEELGPKTKKLTVNFSNDEEKASNEYQSNDRSDIVPEQFVAPRNPTRTISLDQPIQQPQQQPQPQQQYQTVNLNRTQSLNYQQPMNTRMINNNYNPTRSLFGNRTGYLSSQSTTSVAKPVEITKIDDLIVRDIENKTNKYMSTRSLLTEDNIDKRTMPLNSSTSSYRTNRVTESLYKNQNLNNSRLIPYNEVKMDHRVRKSQRREFKFINGGSF